MANRWIATALIVLIFLGSNCLQAADAPSYVIEAPDILKIEVTGLPKKAPNQQQLNGAHIVRPDGTVALGSYGSVYVAGLTIKETQTAIAKQLATFFKKGRDIQVNVEVVGFNSKCYYVIVMDKKNGDQVFRFPCTGNETICDVVLREEGLAALATKAGVYVAPSKGEPRPVDWRGITQEGKTATNWVIKPGDRVYIGAEPPK